MNNTNDFFNVKRFGSYAARNYVTGWKRYLVQASILLGLLILSLAIAWFANGKGMDAWEINGFAEFCFGAVLAAATIYFTVSVMKPLRNRHTLNIENTVPASLFEKFIFTLLNTTVVLGVIFLAAYLITALLGMTVLGAGGLGDYFHSQNDGQIFRFIFWGILPLQAVTMYAGTMERRSHVFSIQLVFVVGAAAAFLFLGLPVLISEQWHTDIFYGPLFLANQSNISMDNAGVSYTLLPPLFSGANVKPPLIATCFAVAGTLLFWIAACFNFRERSIK